MPKTTRVVARLHKSALVLAAVLAVGSSAGAIVAVLHDVPVRACDDAADAEFKAASRDAPMIDPTNGRVVLVSEDQVIDAFSSRRLNLQSGGVSVRSPTGKLGSLDAKDAYQAFREGYEFVAPARAAAMAKRIKCDKESWGETATGFWVLASFGAVALVALLGLGAWVRWLAREE